MQQINLSQPCDVPIEQMTPTSNGWYCGQCAKQVIDYAAMTDAQVLAHIKKHGLGCGSFLDTQLSRPIATVKKRVNAFRYAYTLLLTFLINSEPAEAQAKHQTEQSPCKISYDNMNAHTDTVIKTENYQIISRRFGSASMICSKSERKTKTIKYYRIPLTKLFFAPKKFKITRNPKP